MRTARAFEPSDGPTTPRCSSRSINRPARAKPTRSLRCSMLVEPRPVWTTSSIASSSRSSPSSSSRAGGCRRDRRRPARPRCSCGRAVWRRQWATTLRTHSSSTHAPWMRSVRLDDAVSISMSPLPISFSAPGWSRMTRLSASVLTENARRLGMFALITPVMTSTDGRCVAITRWMPTARVPSARGGRCSSRRRGPRPS